MSYASDVFARFGSELELYDSLLSEASAAADDSHTEATIATSTDDAEAEQSTKASDPKKPIHDIVSAIRPTDASSSLPSLKTILSLLDKLDDASHELTDVNGAQAEELKVLALSRLICATYAVAIDSLLQDAAKLDEETWYWTEIEESTRKTFGYLVQTLPARVAKVVRETFEMAADTATHTLRNTLETSSSMSKAKNVDRATLKKTFRNILNTPNMITSMLFPYTFHLERSITLHTATQLQLSADAKTTTGAFQQSDDDGQASTLSSASKSKKQRIKALRSTVLTLTPTYLVRHEAKCKRRGLIHERDQLAERLGRLALQQNAEFHADGKLSSSSQDPKETILKHLNSKLKVMIHCFDTDAPLADNHRSDEDQRIEMDSSLTPDATLGTLRLFLKEQLPRQQDRVKLVLSPNVFGQPSGFTQRWPTLVLYPIGFLFLGRYLSKNWTGIEAKLKESRETVQNFFIGWIWEPCVGLLDTIRHGNEGSVIMSRDSLNSDLQSLERMVADFTKDQYGITGAELDAITAKVREGDLTQVLKVYETEMKNPVKSMVKGSLVRSLLIQIQKAKVDLEVAMSGIDKLLKSQQLLFGAVGIAPALGILYIGQRYIRTKVWNISTYRSRSQGQNYQTRAWEAMRRVDRLLASSSSPASTTAKSSNENVGASGGKSGGDGGGGDRDALIHGLLLLDLSTLRSASGPLLLSLANGKKASAKRLQKHFLQDIRDLENGQTSAVERMWRSWAGVFRPA